MDLFELSATLRLDKSEYENGLDDAERSAESKGAKISSFLSGAGKTAAAGIGAIAAGTAALSTALVSGTSDVANYGDNIDKMSQKMGISAEAYQEWDAILQHSGTSIDSMSRGMQTLQKNAVNSAEKFEALGITQEQLASMSTEELFSATISGLQQMGEGAERTALASELLGGSAKELGALLNTSAEDTEAMRQAVHDLGGVMSNDAVKAAAAYQDSLQDMNTAIDGIKRGLISEFLPSVTTAMDGITAILSGNVEEGQKLLEEGVKQFIEKLKTAIPAFLETAKSLIGAFGQAITQNLPDLIKAGVEILGVIVKGLVQALPQLAQGALQLINGLTQGIVENLPALLEAAQTIITGLIDGIITYLPDLLEAGLQIITNLAFAIIEALPEIIPAVIDIIMKIVEILTNPDNIVRLVEGAIKIMVALTTGLIQAIPQLLAAVPQIIVALVTAIVTAAPQLLEAGVTLIQSLISGMLSFLGNIVSTGKELITSLITSILDVGAGLIDSGAELVNNIISGITGLFTDIFNTGADLVNKVGDGVKSLLKNAVTWGKDLISNFIDGIKSMASALWDTVGDIASGIKDYLGFSEPKLGPLSNFHTYAPDMMDLFMQGINNKQRELQDTVANAFDFQDVIEGDVNVSGNGDLFSMLQTIVGILPNLGNMQVVLDTGALVGQTASAYDVALGQLYTDKARSV